MTADVVVSPTSEAEVARRPRRRLPARDSGHPARRRHRQLRPGDAADGRRADEPGRDEQGPVDRAGPRRLRARRAHHRRRQGGGSVRAGTAHVPVHPRHRFDRRLRRRRVRRRRLDHLGGLARFRQCAAPPRHDARGRAAHARTDGRGSAQGGARLWHQRNHHRGRDAADGALRLGRRHRRVRQFRRRGGLCAGARRAGRDPEEAGDGRRRADAARLFPAPSRAHSARRRASSF